MTIVAAVHEQSGVLLDFLAYTNRNSGWDAAEIVVQAKVFFCLLSFLILFVKSLLRFFFFGFSQNLLYGRIACHGPLVLYEGE